MKNNNRRLGHVTTSLALLAMSGHAACAADATEVTLLIDNAPNVVAFTEALSTAFEQAHPDIDIKTEIRAGGAEGDNIVKTRLATGEMTDIFFYNSGSKFQELSPETNLLALSDAAFLDRVLPSFTKVVSAGGNVYGAPIGSATATGIFYNRAVYEELGLDAPKTWEEFLANCDKIKQAGYTPVIQSYGTTWTSQMIFLGDFYNVQAKAPDFAEAYTNNIAKVATTPAALRGFEKQADLFNGGYLNEDFAAATFEDALAMLAMGDGIQWPISTYSLGAIASEYPEALDNIGFFPVPGDDASANGFTIGMPPALYISAKTEHAEEAKMFLDFVASPEGCAVMTEAVGASGPYLVKGCSLPDDVPPAVAEMLPYFERDDGTAAALEYVSPLKGPMLEQILVEVGSGFRSPLDGAELYDQDVRKQALQLGLEGW